MEWTEHFAAQPFKSLQIHRALAMRVLCVAHTLLPEHWAAYVDAVPGMQHELETEPVLRVGEKLPEDVARALFPEYAGLPYYP